MVCQQVADAQGIVHDCDQNHFGEGKAGMNNINFPGIGCQKLDLMKVYFSIFFFPFSKGIFSPQPEETPPYTSNCPEHGLLGAGTRGLPL